MLIPSLLCVHVYTLSLLCLPSLLYLYSYLLWLPMVSWSFTTCMPSYLDYHVSLVSCLYLVCYIPTYQPKSQLDQDTPTQCATIWLPSLFCLPSLLQLPSCNLLEHVCQQVYLPYHAGACMPLLTVYTQTVIHLLSLATQFAVPTQFLLACLVFYTYFSVLSYLAIVHHTYSLCVVYSLHCLISLPVSCWSLPIACLLYMPIQFATPKQSSKPPIYAPIVFYPQVASISNIRSILSNRAYSITIVVPQNLVLNFAKIKQNQTNASLKSFVTW